ncbi:MAG: glycogen synthase GlgA [Candidatus Omnitrophica bacterium]|nr:glycogen synthase GlgA [Candidatus Omnitrophota bacterium]
MSVPKRKKILFTASEAVPFIKTGGLGDVAGALPKALARRGHDVRLVIPRYWAVDPGPYEMTWAVSPMGVPLGGRTVWCAVRETVVDGLRVYLIEHEHYFGRSGLYDDGKREYPDNAERFAFFSESCLQLCRDTGFSPDILHCNDWQTAMIPVYLKTRYREDPLLRDTATVFSIHNIGHQGIFRFSNPDRLGIRKEDIHPDRLENYGGINMMKGAIFYADGITTVSPSYAGEILSPVGGSGLAPYLQRRKDDVSGILNGVDYDHWDPEKDPHIPAAYSAEDLSGKAECKKALQRAFHLQEKKDVPVIGVVSRFAEQKGFQHVIPVMEDILRDMEVQFAFLGCGEKYMEDFFGGLPARYPGRVGAWIGYSNERAHLIEAGADLFLMPSLYEPCGLNQIYSLKYGTLPIVREIGGLKDTVKKYNERTGDGTGFTFRDAGPASVYYTTGWAVSTYYDRPEHFDRMRRSGMREHFSWDDSAARYEEAYERAGDRRSAWR